MKSKQRLVVGLAGLLLLSAIWAKAGPPGGDEIHTVIRTQRLEVVSADGTRVYARVTKEGLELLNEQGQTYATLKEAVPGSFPTLRLSSGSSSTSLSNGSLSSNYIRDGQQKAGVVISFRDEFGSLLALDGDRGRISLSAAGRSLTLENKGGKRKVITPTSETITP